MVYACNGFLQYSGISYCNIMEFLFATFVIFILQQTKIEYKVLINKKYRFMKKEGEIDVIVVSDSDIILIECKCPLSPINNFEMRSSLDHIEKANKQLDLSKKAFQNKEFRKKYFDIWDIEDKDQNILTCIVFGNRLFNGYNLVSHPIRYIHELDMVLNKGIIYSSMGKWSVWKGETFSHEDLLNYLSEDKSLISLNFKSMDKVDKIMFIKDKKIIFKTYVLNFPKVLKLYDSNLRIIKSKDKL